MKVGVTWNIVKLWIPLVCLKIKESCCPGKRKKGSYYDGNFGNTVEYLLGQRILRIIRCSFHSSFPVPSPCLLLLTKPKSQTRAFLRFSILNDHWSHVDSAQQPEKEWFNTLCNSKAAQVGQPKSWDSCNIASPLKSRECHLSVFGTT